VSQQNVEIVRRAIDAFIRRDLDATVQDARGLGLAAER
jgi:hypothetical protein